MKRKVTAQSFTLTIPTYPEAPYETLPMFAETRNHQATSGNPFPNAVTLSPCAETAEEKEYIAVRLENKYIQLIILPQLGGRIFAALDKRSGYNFFYRQHVIKPALIGCLGSWISGGVEFNWPFHHRPATYMATDWTIETGDDGSATVWLSDSDPYYRMKGTVGICLYPDKCYLETKVRVTNRTSVRHPFLWWQNAAVSVNENYRLFFPHDVDHVVHHYRTVSTSWPVAKGNYSGCDFGGGTDISLIYNAPHSTSYFAAPSKFDFFGGYDEGWDAGVIHIADHHISPGKKMFTWGRDQNAKSWETKLTDTDGPYCELMAGVYTDNQPDFTWLAPYETKSFSQYWYPITKTGVPDYADLQCSVTVKGDKVSVASTSALPDVRVRLSVGDEELCDELTEFKDATTLNFKLSRKVNPGECWRIQVTSAGRPLSDYTDEKFPAQTPRIIGRRKTPDEIDSAYEAYNVGEHLILYRDPVADPEKYWERSIKLDKHMIPAYLSLAESRIRRGLYDEAEKLLDDATVLRDEFNQRPESGKIHYLYGLCYQRQGRYDDAYDAFRKAMWSYDKVSAAATKASALALRRRDWKDARALAGMAYESDNSNSAAVIRMLLADYRLHDDAAVKADIALLSEEKLNMTYAWALVSVGMADEGEFFARLQSPPSQTVIDVACEFMSFGFNTEARKLLDGAINRLPEEKVSAMVYYLAGLTPPSEELCRVFPTRPEEALALEKAIEADPRDEFARYLLGVLRMGQRRYGEAEALWSGGKSCGCLRGLAICAWRRGARAKALELLRRACKAARKGPELDAAIFESAYLMNQTRADPEKTISLILSAGEPERDDTALELITAYCRAGKAKKALELLKAHNFRPGEGSEAMLAYSYINTVCSLGDEHFRRGEIDTALENYLAAQSIPEWLDGNISGESPFARAKLGEAECLLRKNPDDEKAKAILARLCDIHPDTFVRADLLMRVGRKDDAVKLLEGRISDWKRQLKICESGYYRSQPAFLSYLEPAAAERRRIFSPLIKRAEETLKKLK